MVSRCRLQGRWLVPDPAGLAAVDLTNPQTWNRYAYVANNPLNRVDPLGLRCAGNTGKLGDCDWVMPSALDGDGNCYEDGAPASCGMVYAMLGMGAAAECPNGVCNGFTTSGTYVQFVAGAGGAAGYLKFSDLTQGINEWGGHFWSNQGYTNLMLSQYGPQIEAQHIALAQKIAGNSGGDITYQQAYNNLTIDPKNGYLQGGNWNFSAINGLGPNSLDCGGDPRCNGVHFPGSVDSNGNPFVHLDTSNPYSGIGGFFQHIGVDVILGNIYYPVIPRPWP